MATLKELAGRLTAAGLLMNVLEDSNEHYMVSLSFPHALFLLVLEEMRTSGQPTR